MQYFSHSKIDSFLKCPRQYKFVNIERAAVEKPVTVEIFVGQSIHLALEKLYQMKSGGKLISSEEIGKVYLDFWEGPDRDRIKITREGMGMDDYIKEGSVALDWYYKQFQPFDEGKVIALERMLNFPLDPGGRFGIRGKVDRITLREDGVVEIVDYKMKKTLPTQQSFDDDEQMGMYQIGVMTAWPDFDRIELKQIFLRQGLTMTATMDKDKIDEIRYRVYQNILEIIKATEDDNFPTKESMLCNWCVYNELCPAKRHRLALDDEITADFDAKMGRELASRYLKINDEIRTRKSQLEALKKDIVRYCDEVDVSNLAGDIGSVSLRVAESETFPSKSENEKAFLEMSHLARQSELDECFKLDQNILYKQFFVKERLENNLMEKLTDFLVKKRRETIRTYYKKQ